jgi:LEA14-like dessication related protein
MDRLGVSAMSAPYRTLSVALVLFLLAGCAGLGLREPLKVTVAGLEPLPSEGLEARFALMLRIQNPNETALDFDGVSVDLELADIDFGSGVSDQRGTIPRYGEALITVPVTVPLLAIVRQVYGLSSGKPRDRVSYRLRGRLGGTGLPGVRFDSRGELLLPAQANRRY